MCIRDRRKADCHRDTGLDPKTIRKWWDTVPEAVSYTHLDVYKRQAPKTAAPRERLLDALTPLADTDPLLRCEVDSITHEIILSFLGDVYKRQHTHIQHTPVCDCCFWGYVKIDKAKVFLNWVQKTKPLQKELS